MSHLEIKYIRATGLFEFNEDHLDSRYCDVVALLDNLGETLKFSQLKYGVILKNGETVIGEKTYPPEGVKIRRSNQSSLSTSRVHWQPDMIIDVEVWMEQTGGKVEGTYQLTVPRPPEPNEGGPYEWDEETLSWIEVG